MLNPKHQRYADRLRELIEEGKVVAGLERPPGYIAGESSIQGMDKIRLHDWLIKVHNIITSVFGLTSPHLHHLQTLTEGRGMLHSREIYPVVGLLQGALNDLEQGYLLGQEFLIAGEVFDSVLEQAKHLNQTGYRDPAAVLMRVVLEDALKRIARSMELDDSQKASQLNDELKKQGRYAQPQWRQIQTWLDIGNAAAHGRFDEYDQGAVERAIEGVELFLATEFRG